MEISNDIIGKKLLLMVVMVMGLWVFTSNIFYWQADFAARYSAEKPCFTMNSGEA